MWEGMRDDKPADLATIFPHASPEALDLLKGLLQINPHKRLSASQALQHPYVAQFHDPEHEPSAGRTITIPIDDNTKVHSADSPGQDLSMFGNGPVLLSPLTDTALQSIMHHVAA